MLPAAAGASAIGTAALGGAAAAGAGALGAGITAGIGLAGGLPGLLGGMGALGGAGTAGSVLGGTALTPAVASLAPAATAQAMGPTLLQASLPGMQGGMGALAPGVTSGATSGLAGAANPAFSSQLVAAQQQAAQRAAELGSQTTGFGAQRAPDLATQMQTAQLKSAGSAPLPADTAAMSGVMPGQNFMQNLGSLMQNPSMQGLKDYAAEHPYATSAAVGLGTKGLMSAMQQKGPPTPENNAMIRPYDFDYGATGAVYQPGGSTSEQLYFNPTYTAGEPYRATEKAEGGIASAYAVGGPVEQMSAMNSVGANTGYPMANINTPLYANPMMQRPEATNVIAPSADAGVGAYSGEPRFARGGDVGVSYGSNLGGYSDGGQLLRGPGSGVSDDIPATIAGKQPARLANNEFVIPARIVSELGNGSTEAGARQLYKMMDRVQAARKKSIGKGKVAVDTKAHKHLPA